MYPASGWSSLGSGPSWKSARLRSHYRTGLSGPFGSPVLAGAGKTDPPSRLVLSQTSAGRERVTSLRVPHLGLDDQTDWAAASSVFLASKFRPQARTLQAMRASLLASAIASTLRCSRFLAASIQALSPWRCQLLGLISTTPRRLNEQDAQVAIATLRYLAEDCAVPGRDLSQDQPEPCGKVAAFGEGLA